MTGTGADDKIDLLSNATLILKELILPRAQLSPTDALFCSRFLQLMHEYRTPGVHLFLIFNQVCLLGLAYTYNPHQAV